MLLTRQIFPPYIQSFQIEVQSLAYKEISQWAHSNTPTQLLINGW